MRSLARWGSFDARELDEDPVLPLLLDRRLGDAELVDPFADGLEDLAHRQLAELADLPGLEGEDEAPGGRIGLLDVEGAHVGPHGLGVLPLLR